MPSEILPANILDRLLEMQPLNEDETNVTHEFPFLKVLTASNSSKLVQLFRHRELAPGEVVLRENQVGDEMFIIWEGRVAIVKGDFETPIILGYRGPGDIVGEMALLENRARSASVVAVEKTKLLVTDRDGFQQLIHEPPFVGLDLLEMLSARLRASDDDRRAKTVRERSLSNQVSALESEYKHLLDLQRVRQETTDLIVHDLRNPLSAMYVAIQALEISLPNEVRSANHEFLEIANSAYRRLLRLIESMLEVSRMDEGLVELNISEFALRDIVGTILAGMPNIQKRSTTVNNHVPVDLIPLQADRERIERVLANLLDNAIKHTPAGGHIDIDARRQGDLVYVSVTDSGPGIPEDERQRIFERFSQVAGEKNRRRGFGLGLTYCKLTVETHGGKIWVEPSPEGTGSRFIFTLPAHRLPQSV